LLQRVISGDKNRLNRTCRNNTPLHHLRVAGENNAVFGQSGVNQVFIVAVVEKSGVITDHPQPFGEFAAIQVDDEPGIFFGAHPKFCL
jgi:hypothetical protein